MDPTSGYTSISIRYVFGQENNGYEQIFSGQTDVIQDCPLDDPECFPMPLPGTVALLGLGLVSLTFLRRRPRRIA
jgi:hypothetical protein